MVNVSMSPISEVERCSGMCIASRENPCWNFSIFFTSLPDVPSTASGTHEQVLGSSSSLQLAIALWHTAPRNQAGLRTTRVFMLVSNVVRIQSGSSSADDEKHGTKAKLLDFDWAGVVDMDRFPIPMHLHSYEL